MLWPGEPPFLIFWLSVVAFSLALAVWVWQRRPAPGANTFTALVLSLVVWSAAQVLHFANALPAAQWFWHKVEFLGMVTVPTAWLAFALRYTSQDKPLTRRQIALLAIEPALTVFLVFTNDAHGLVWRSPGASTAAGLEWFHPGLWFWVHTLYAHALLFGGTLLFIQPLMRGSRLYRTQGLALLLGILLAWIGGNLHTFLPAVGPAPLAVSLLLFNLSAASAMLHYRLFELIPVARATVVEQLGDAMFVFDVQRRLVDCNQAAQRLLGRPASALLGQPADQLFPTYQELIAQYRQAATLHQEIAFRQGEAQRYFDLHVTPLRDRRGETAGHLVLLYDLTARKHAEEALQKAELEKTLILDHMVELLVYQDTTHRVLWTNRVAAASVGLTPQELAGRYCYEIWHQRSEPCVGCPVARARESGQPQEGEMATPDGRVWLVRGYPVRDAQGNVIGIVEVTQDITVRKRAEGELRKSEERYRSLFQRVPVGLYRTTPEGRIVDANTALVKMFGYPDLQSLQAVNAQDIFVNPEDRQRELALLERDGFVHGFEMQQRRYDGSVIWVQDSAHAVRDAAGKVLYYEGSLEDITARKQAEEALQQRVAELAALQATVLDIAAPHELTALLQRIVERAAALLHAPGGGLYLCDPVRQEARCVVSYRTKRDYTGTVLKYGEGAAGMVAQTGKPLIIDDYRTWAHRGAVFEQEQPFTAVCSAPMIWQGQVIGVIHVLEDKKLRQFTAQDAELLSLFANHAALAVQNARLHEAAQEELAERKRAEEQLQRRNLELTSLYETALEITAQLDLQQLLPAITKRAMYLLNADSADLSLYRAEHDDLQAVVVQGVPGEFIGTVLKRGEGLSGKVLQSGEAMTVEDYATWPGRAHIYNGQHFGAMAATPIKWKGEILGTLDVARKSGLSFTPEEVSLLSLLANQAAIAIANARLYEAMQRELAERKHAEEQLQRRNLELTSLYETALEITAQLDLQQLLPVLVERANYLLQGLGTGIYLYRPQTDDLQYVAGCREDQQYVGHVLKRGEGLAGKVLESGLPMTVANYASWPGRSHLFAMHEPRAVLSMPVKWGEEILGVLDVLRESEASFSDDDIRLLSLFANQAAIAIHNARIVATEAQQRRRAEALAQATAVLSSTLELEPLLENILRAAIQAIPAAEKGSILLIDETSGELHVRALVGYSDPRIHQARFVRQEGYSYKAVQEGRSLIIADARTGDICYNGEIEEMRAIQSAIVAPLCYRERIIGVISLDNASRKAAFTEHDLSLLAAFAAQAVVAIANARLYEEAQRELAERRKTEAALRASEQRYRSLFESSQEGIVITDAESRIVAVNPTAAKILGYSSPAELMGVSGLDLYPDPTQKRTWFQELMQKGYVEAMELRLKRRDGAEAHILGGGVLRRDAEGNILGTEMMFMDITALKHAEKEQKKLEEQLRQAQKMEAMGLLAGGIAHEFNNLLTIIMGNAELGLMSLDPSNEAYSGLSAIHKTATRAAALTRQILAFSRRQILYRKELDLNALLTNLSLLLRSLIGESIQLRTELAPGLPPLFADAGAIEQVVMNLALNARDAMPDGGVLCIETAALTLDEAFCSTHPEAKPGEYVRLSVVDTGIGMDDSVKEHLFEPFFTTKDVGKGSGLGLSVVYGIVKQHNGLIEVESSPGQGTRFAIYLPAYQPPERKRRRRRAPGATLPKGTETILIAEDEQPVRELAQEVLERLGYIVLATTDGAEAVEMFAANPERIDLVILDAVMPKLSGQKAYEAMAKLRPDLPVLFITGYSAELVHMPPSELAILPILQKPFSVAEIGCKVREVLDARK